MRKTFILSASMAIAFLALGSTANAAGDEAMRSLASKSGCFICHGIEKDAKGPDGMKPVGPPFKAVAERYKGDKNAAKTLLGEVLAGTSPYSRHWKDDASGIAMPPNGVTVPEVDAKKIVDWILHLK